MANDADTVTISAPLNKDKAEIQKLVLGKASWRNKENTNIQYRRLQNPLLEGVATLPYLGCNYPLKIDRNQAICFI
jgi:predicted metal-dependent hydrolase